MTSGVLEGLVLLCLLPSYLPDPSTSKIAAPQMAKERQEGNKPSSFFHLIKDEYICITESRCFIVEINTTL